MPPDCEKTRPRAISQSDGRSRFTAGGARPCVSDTCRPAAGAFTSGEVRGCARGSPASGVRLLGAGGAHFSFHARNDADAWYPHDRTCRDFRPSSRRAKAGASAAASPQGPCRHALIHGARRTAMTQAVRISSRKPFRHGARPEAPVGHPDFRVLQGLASGRGKKMCRCVATVTSLGAQEPGRKHCDPCRERLPGSLPSVSCEAAGPSS